MAGNSSLPAPALKLETEKSPAEVIVRCTGKITLETAPLFEQAIRDLIPDARCILIDLTHVSHIDSSGLGALTSVWSSARRKSAEVGFRWPEPSGQRLAHEIHFVNINDHVRKLLRLTRLDKLFGIRDESAEK